MFQKIIYFVKFMLHYVLSCIGCCSIIAVAVVKRRWKDGRNTLLGSRMSILFSELLGLTVVVEDKYKVDATESFIVVMNHQSCLDITIISHIALLLGNMAPVVKKLMILLAPPIGVGVLLSGGLLIEKRRKSSALKNLNLISVKLKGRQQNLIIFPEGTRNDSDELLPFKKGAFHMSVQSDLRILPIVVQKYPFLDHEKKIFGRGQVKVEILQPLKKFKDENIDDFAKRTYDLMNERYQELNTYTAGKIKSE